MLDNVLARPQIVNGLEDRPPIEIYPVTIADYDKFNEYNRLLYISKKHFQIENNEAPLLSLIFISSEFIKISQEEIIDMFSNLFSIVTRKYVSFGVIGDVDGFVVYDENNKENGNSDNIISSFNYDEIRSIIMRQNLMFEKKVYKDPKVQEWAELVLKQKMKNLPKISIEEMLSTVSVLTGKHYWELEKYSIYQIYTDFYRARKNKEYDVSVMAKCQGGDIDIKDFAECLDLYKNPYDDLFVSSDKINKFN